MKAGLWGARGDGGGLGALTWEWYRHLQPERTMGIDLGERGRGPTVRSRFPDAEWQQGMNHDIPEAAVRRFMRGLDVVFMAETGYRDDVCHIARQEGCATVLMEMPEMHRADHAPPDRVWAPTDWRLDALAPETQIVPVPVARDRLPYRHRIGVSTWLHVAAPAMLDRNGTRLVLGALAHVRTPCRVILAGHGTSTSNVGVVTVETRAEPTLDYWDAYGDEVDALLLPRRYGGLCLSAGTMIATPTGDVPIETLRTGDLVCDERGATRVTGTAVRIVPDIVNVRVRGTTLTSSADHLHLVASHRFGSLDDVKAQHVEPGDWMLAVPPFPIKPSTIQIGPRPNHKGPKRWAETVDLDVGWARLIGLWLAEGWYKIATNSRSHVVCWAFGSHETDLADEVISLLADRGIYATKRLSKVSDAAFGPGACWVVRTRSRWLCAVLDALQVGHGAHGKAMPNIADDLVLPLVSGWLDGDGSINNKRNSLSGWSESRQLIYGLWRALQRVQIFAAVNHDGRRLDLHRWDDIQRVAEYCRRLKPERVPLRERRSPWTEPVDQGWRVHVRSIEKATQRTIVHSLETESGHYVANGFVTHNSLPLEEAASRGMPIVTLELAPQDQWVPPAGLVPAWEWRQIRMPGGTFAVHTADPRQVAAAMDRVMRPEVASACSAAVGDHAATVAWADWAGRYRTLMASVLGSRC